MHKEGNHMHGVAKCGKYNEIALVEKQINKDRMMTAIRILYKNTGWADEGSMYTGEESSDDAFVMDEM